MAWRLPGRVIRFALPTLGRLAAMPQAVAAYLLSLALVALTIATLHHLGRMPWHDAKVFLDGLHAFYNILHQSGDYPRWLDLGIYGYPVYFLQFALQTPSQVVAALIGGLFGAEDTLALYYLSIFLVHFILVTGSLLLGTALFRHWLPIALLVIVAGLSTVWLARPTANLMALYALPLSLYFFVVGLRRGSFCHLALAGIALLALFSTVLGRYGGVMILIFACYGIAFLAFTPSPRRRVLIRGLTRSALTMPSLAATAVMLVLAVAILASLVLTMGETQLLRSDDGGEGLAIPLSNFLTYGRRLAPLRQLISGLDAHSQDAHYIGLVPLVLFVVGIPIAWRRRHAAEHKALLVLCLCLLGLAAGGLTTVALYLVPTMQFYRGLSAIYAFLQVFLIVGAAFGLDQLLTALRRPGIARAWRARMDRFWQRAAAAWERLGRAGLIGLLVLTVVSIDILALNLFMVWKLGVDAFDLLVLARVATILGTVALVFLLLGPLRRVPLGPRRHRADAIVWLLLLGTVVSDLASYQVVTVFRALEANGAMVAFYRTHPLTWHPQRIERMDDSLTAAYMAWYEHQRAKNVGPNTQYETVNIQFDIDPCLPHLAGDWDWHLGLEVISFARPVKELIDLRGGRVSRFESNLPETDLWLRRALACGHPKLRVTANVERFADGARMRAALEAPDFPADPGRALVVAEGTPSGVPPAAGAEEGAARMVDYAPHRLSIALDRVPDGAWLILSVPYHKGWHATVDGVPRPVSLANGAFLGLPLEPGDRQVEIRFDDPLGLAVCLFGAMVDCIAVLAVLLLGILAVVLALSRRPRHLTGGA